jgi:Uri superfamily endonuclease
VGSAKKNFEKRIERHLRRRKKKFWHVDYLLHYAEVKSIWIGTMPEEKIAPILTKYLTVAAPGFGSSDTTSVSHLFVSTGNEDFSQFSFDLLTDLKKGLSSK